ncbi:hypothetical protein IJD44_02610, partial [bacterium]|nr:hypothetical protein [bacterium]
NGIMNCKNSPTILEEDLHNAIIDSLKEILPKFDDIAKKVENEIEAVMKKDDDNNPQVIQRKIQNFEKEIEVLRNILKETDDKEFYIEKIKRIENELLKLNKIDSFISEKESYDLLNQIKNIVNNKELNMDTYFDIVTRKIVQNILVYRTGKINVIYD